MSRHETALGAAFCAGAPLRMGIFLGLWVPGLVVLFSTGVWTSLGHMVDVFRGHRSARKKRAAVTALIGTCSIFSFLAVGLLAGMTERVVEAVEMV